MELLEQSGNKINSTPVLSLKVLNSIVESARHLVLLLDPSAEFGFCPVELKGFYMGVQFKDEIKSKSRNFCSDMVYYYKKIYHLDIYLWLRR